MITIHKMPSFSAQQRGVSTLVITLLLLVIISLVVLFSTSVGFFEQRTASNENRARIAEQAAETGINMAGEYIKVNRNKIISKAADGWLDADTTNAGWKTCNGVASNATLDSRPHPCLTESNTTRRNQLWFYTTDGTGSAAGTSFLNYGSVGNVGGSAAFPSIVNVQAVLCRIDSSLSTPVCASSPSSGNRVAITFISHARLTGENSEAVIKETWASFTDVSPGASVPLMAAGIIKGLGNSQVVANPNAGGSGLAASMWSPNNIGFGTTNTNSCTDGSSNAAASGIGSSSTCQIEDYLSGTAFTVEDFKTGCAPNGAACGCPNTEGRYISGHVAGNKAEGYDILDIDSNVGTNPDISFFPGTSCQGTQRDDPADPTDDSLFEWVFNADVVTEGTATTKSTNSVNQTCTPNLDCAVNALLVDLSATAVTCAALNTLGGGASGIYYVAIAGCNVVNVIGSPTSPAIVVFEEDMDLKNNFYGMIFVRSRNNTAELKVSGNNKVFGSMVVEGDVDVTGTIDLVYDDTGVNTDPFTFPSSAKFARLPGSWLDATEGF